VTNVPLQDEYDPQLSELGEICAMMLAVNPRKRPSAKQLMEMSFFKTEPSACSPKELVGDLKRLHTQADELNEFFARERIKAKMKRL
jgi:serine/threonine protein kinase